MRLAEVREQCKEFLIKELNINPLLPMYDGYIDACVKYASQFREPSTQGGEEQLDGLLKSQLRELAERRKKDYDRLADSFERLKQENEDLKFSCMSLEGAVLASDTRIQVLEEALRKVMDKNLGRSSIYVIAKQALNPKD